MHGKTTAAFGSDSVSAAPVSWRQPCANTEYTLHQLSPYIGKIKSRIAAELVEAYSIPGDLVVDPFAGSGTIPFEAAVRERRVFASDNSPYARILTLGKLNAPRTLADAECFLEKALKEADAMPLPDVTGVPGWVRSFFHPDTLREIIRFAQICRRSGNEFLMAALLGILHHQRPGFLSFPSSHLVPYLRDKKYPRSEYPELYEYRDLEPRLRAKLRRSYRRMPREVGLSFEFVQRPVEELAWPAEFNALITSPPYMNALDYGRDNRLRLWFIDPTLADRVDNVTTRSRIGFSEAIDSVARRVESNLTSGGWCVFVVGSTVRRGFSAHPSNAVSASLKLNAPSLHLETTLVDQIPDVRRTRRECSGVKTEYVLIYRKT